MISKNYLENGTVTATYINETDMGVTNIYYNNETVSSSTTNLALNPNNTVQLEVKTKNIENFNRLNNIKISIMPMHLDERYPITLQILSPSEFNTVENFEVSTILGRYEVDITKYVHEIPGRTLYFELSTEANYNLLISGYDKPYLEVNYLDLAASSRHPQTISNTVGKHVNYSADIKDGSLVLSKALYSLTGALMPINLSIVHSNFNSSQIVQKGFPLGWKFNYYEKVEQSDSIFIYYDTKGIKHELKPTSNLNKYIERAGTGLILELLSNGKYQIENTIKEQLIFNSNGDLECIRKRFGGSFLETVLGYDSEGRIASITDPMGNVVSVTYLTNSICLSCTNHKSIILTVQNNCLTTVNEEPGRLTTFTYDILEDTDNEKLLLAVSSDNGEKATFEYDYENRVSQITDSVVKDGTESILENRVVSYQDNITKVTNYHGVCMCYTFDDEGQTVKVYEEDNHKSSLSIQKDGMHVKYNEHSTDKFIQLGDCSLSISNEEYKTANSYLYKTGELTVPDQHTLNLEGNTEYLVTFDYLLSGVMATPIESRVSYISVMAEVVNDEGQTEDVVLSALELDLDRKAKTSSAFIFKTPDSFNKIKIEVVHSRNTGNVTIENAYIYKYIKNQRIVCFNAGTEDDEAIMCGEDEWYPRNTPFTKITYTDLDGESKTKSVKLYEEDFNEAFKNSRLSNGNTYNLFYNKCRDVLLDVKDVFVYIDDTTTVSIEDIRMCALYETDNQKVFIYDDYSSSEETVLKTQYQKTLFNGSIFTDYKVISKEFKVLKDKTLDGIIMTYTYDSYGNLLSEEMSSTASNTQKVTKNYTYLDGKYLQSVTTLNGNLTTSTETYEYNTKGLLSKKIMPNNLQVLYTYDPYSLEVTKINYTDGSNTYENNITYTNDLVTNLAYTTNIGYDFTYDEYNKIKFVNSFRNGTTNNILTHSSNITDELDEYEVIYPTGYKEKVIIDEYGNKVRKLYSNNTSYVPMKEFIYSDYDANNSIVKSTMNPLNEELNKTASSKLRKIVDMVDNNETFFHYNEDDLIEKISSDGISNLEDINFLYDDNKRLLNKELIKDGLQITNEYQYKNNDSFPTKEIEKTTITLTKNDTAYGNYQVEYGKDSLNRKLSEKLTVESKTINKSYTYSKTSDNKTTVLPSKIMYTHTSSSLSKAIGNLPTITTLLNTSYTYNNMNNITGVSDPITSSNVTYSYDLFGRLIRENNQKLNKTTLFTYDGKGNITKKVVAAYTTSSTVTPTETINYGYSSVYPDRLTSYGGQTVSYDANGNITQIGSETFTWSNGKQLTSSTINGKKYNYSYNGDGVRTTKIVVGQICHDYVVEGNKIITETITSSTSSQSHELIYIYSGDEIIGLICDDAKYLFIKNLQHDIIGIVTSSGNIVARYEYDAWGNHKVYNASGVENTSDTFIGNINPFRYRGYYYDKESNLYYCQTRYYSPKLCRWLSLDSVKYLNTDSFSGLNLYCYCDNNSVNQIDSSGNKSFNMSTLWNILTKEFRKNTEIFKSQFKEMMDLFYLSLDVSFKQAEKVITGIFNFELKFEVEYDIEGAINESNWNEQTIQIDVMKGYSKGAYSNGTFGQFSPQFFGGLCSPVFLEHDYYNYSEEIDQIVN